MRATWMYSRMSGLVAVLCAGFVLCGGCPWPYPTDTSLIEQATTRARLLDPDAIVFQASGVNGATLDGTGSQTLAYTFMAIDPDAGNVTYELSYNGTSWTTSTHLFPVLGVGYYDLREVTMTETQARTILQNAGYGDDFHGWSLYRPLYPSSIEALYTFNYGTMTVTVNTATQAVTISTAEAGVPALGTAPGEDSVSLQMIADADAQIKTTSSSAFIIWAGGRDGDGAALNGPADTNVWDFFAVALSETSVSAWRLTYDGTWTTEELPMPPFSIEFLDLATGVSMDVVEAWDLVLAAGYGPPLGSWEVFKPLNPSVEHVVYVFSVSSGFVIVDTVTGEVELEANCCNTDACYGHCSGE